MPVLAIRHQGLAIHSSLNLAAVMDGHDIRMGQRGHESRFPMKGEERRIVLKRWVQDLDGHRPVKTELRGPVDLARAPFADLILNVVPGDFPSFCGRLHFGCQDGKERPGQARIGTQHAAGSKEGLDCCFLGPQRLMHTP